MTADEDFERMIDTLPVAAGVYVLLGQNGRRYTGAARNIRARLKDHRAGRCSRTKSQRPLKIVLIEVADSFQSALKRERYLKTGQGRAWLNSRQTVSP